MRAMSQVGESTLSPMRIALLSCAPDMHERCEPVALGDYTIVPVPVLAVRGERDEDTAEEGFSTSSVSSDVIMIALIIAIVVVITIIIVVWILAGRKSTKFQEQFDADEEAREDKEEQAELDEQVSSEIVIVQQARPYVVGYRGDTSHRRPETTPERGAEPVFETKAARTNVPGPPRRTFTAPPVQ
jgi:flagellar basal body-associated protein FliL